MSRRRRVEELEVGMEDPVDVEEEWAEEEEEELADADELLEARL